MHKIGKKAIMYEPVLVFFVIIILSAAFYNISTSESTNIKISKPAADLIDINEDITLKLDFIEQASFYHIYKSLNELGQNSGYNKAQLAKCKSWTENTKNCYLNKEKIIENFKYYLSNYFNDYIKSQNLNLYSINVISENNKLKITFNSNLKFSKNNIEHYTDHKFSKEVDYDINKYEDLFVKYSKEDKFLTCPDKDQRSMAIDELEPGLICLDKGSKDEFLYFEYKNKEFYFNNPDKSFKYPDELQPVIKFKLRKLFKPTIIEP